MKLYQLTNFINESKTFNGIDFSGCYTMPTEIFIKLLKYYLETGENLLDDYSRLTYLSWEQEVPILEPPKHIMLNLSLNIFLKLEIFKNKQSELRNKIKEGYRKYIEFEENKSNEKRQLACRYTAKIEVKEHVFNKYGKKCLRCGSDENITLDHVVPVIKGGKNSLDNLQPLCASCNSWKNSKTIDFRK